jgi:hypothetical protein
MTFPPDAPLPDAIEQATPVADDDEDDEVSPALDDEVDEADALDQSRVVPLDDDDDR